jgi:hypothetical protein
MKKNIVILTNSDTENMYKYKTCTNIKHVQICTNIKHVQI